METHTAHTKRRRLSHESILLPQSYNLILVPETASTSTTSSANTTSNSERPCSSTNQHENNNPTDSALYLWQQNQMLKCVEDNSINHVLESYLQFFEEDTRVTDLPVRNFNPSNTGLRIEESAILMAISEHGLQNPEIMVVEPNLNQSENEVCDFTNVEHNPSHSQNMEQEQKSDENEPLINEEMFNEHFDFMEQAIQSAIQKKGLTPFASSSQMSPTR